MDPRLARAEWQFNRMLSYYNCMVPNGPYAIDNGRIYGPFHRCEMQSATRDAITNSGFLVGAARRGGEIPCAQAWAGCLPAGEDGVEFWTPIRPLEDLPFPERYMVNWRHDLVPFSGLIDNSITGTILTSLIGDVAIIPIIVTKKT